MNCTGTFELESQTNFVSFMKSIDVSDEMIENMKDEKSTTEIKQNGDEYKITLTTGENKIINEFTIGQKSELNTLTGEKAQTTPQRDGNKICMDMGEMKSTIECIGDILITTMIKDNIVFTRVSKRVSEKVE